MKYFLELNSQFSCIESYDATEKLMRMYDRFLCFKLIFVDIEEIGISRCIFIGESDLDLSRENGVHSDSSLSPYKKDGLRYTTFIQVDAFPVLEETDYSNYKVIYPTKRGGGQQVTSSPPSAEVSLGEFSIRMDSERSQQKNFNLAVSYLKSRSEHKQNSKIVRRYVLSPVERVKDMRSGKIERDVEKVLNGDLSMFYEN